MQLYTILSFYKLDFFIPGFYFLEQRSQAWRPGREEEGNLAAQVACWCACVPPHSSTYMSSEPVYAAQLAQFEIGIQKQVLGPYRINRQRTCKTRKYYIMGD